MGKLATASLDGALAYAQARLGPSAAARLLRVAMFSDSLVDNGGLGEQIAEKLVAMVDLSKPPAKTVSRAATTAAPVN